VGRILLSVAFDFDFGVKKLISEVDSVCTSKTKVKGGGTRVSAPHVLTGQILL
jgi:hypothetical protein